MSVTPETLAAFKKGLPTVGVSIVVFHNDSVLVLHRTTPPLIWWVPSGYLEKGEQWLECAKRELQEETGIQVALHFVGVFNLVLPADEGGDHVVSIAYAGRTEDSDVVLNEESSGFDWVPLEVFLQRVSPIRRATLRAAQKTMER